METQPKSPIDRETVRHFWLIGNKNKKLWVLSLLIPIGAICIYNLVPFYIGKILAALSQHNSTGSHYYPYLIGVAIVGVISNRIGFVNFISYQAKSMSRLQSEALETLLSRSASFHANRVSGKLVSDAIEYPTAFNQLSNALFVNIIPFVTILISGIALVLSKSLLLGLILAVMSVLAIGSGYRQSRKNAPLRQKRLQSSQAVIAHMADTIVNNLTVKTFSKEKHELATHQKLGTNLLNRRLHDWQIGVKDGNNRIAVLLASEILFILLIVRLIQRDPDLLSIGIFAFSYTITLINRLFEINTMIRSIEDALLQAQPMTEVRLESPEIQDAPGAQDLKIIDGEILFDNVIFKYADTASQKNVFTNLNITIKAGEKIGLVGPSGGGKTTLTRLLLRFDDIESGSITIDKQNVALATQASLRRVISYVPQEPLLFHRSIGENIAYGQQDAKPGDIRKAAKLAYADGFIQDLPNHYETVVGERGVKLSGGQRQRIAIARAILKNAPILVFDEATSALDSESEKLIQEALWKLMEGRTTIVIAHRLSTIQRMDRIVVLENGKIVEQGSHKELLEKRGIYAGLWAHQSGGFLDD